jgi:hypothetical protein
MKKIDDQPQIVMASADTDEKQEDKINAPVPKIRPAYANDEEPTIASALLDRKTNNPAEEAMQAALTPQPADSAKAAEDAKAADEAQPQFADLKSYHVPVPQLLGERKQPGDSQEDVLTASLDPNDTATLAAVPVPDVRPEVQAIDQTKTATTASSDDIKVPPADIKPTEIAALAAQTTADDQADDTTDEDEADSIADSLDSADKDQQSNLAEMASLDVPKGQATATRSFVLPANVADQLNDAAAVEPKGVIKGGRPKKADDKADSATRTEPKLTENLIAQWALAKGRTALIAKPIKAPRFVSRTMRNRPNEVYADGFQANAVQIDPARFSGTAVNFMPVKKFSETN